MTWRRERPSFGFLFGVAGGWIAVEILRAVLHPPAYVVAYLGAMSLAGSSTIRRLGLTRGVLLGLGVGFLLLTSYQAGWRVFFAVLGVGVIGGVLGRPASEPAHRDVSEVFD